MMSDGSLGESRDIDSFTGDQQTQCQRCQDAGRECIRAYTYRFHKARFASDQKWFNVKPLNYVDETRRIIDYYASDVDSPSDLLLEDVPLNIGSPFGITEERSQSAPLLNVLAGESANRAYVNSGRDQVYTSQTHTDQALSISQILNTQSGRSTPMLSHQAQTMGSFQLPGISNMLPGGSGMSTPKAIVPAQQLQPFPSHIHAEQPTWPLKDRAEAHLLRHFIKHLAIWLDLCDPLQHFQTVVPQRAGSSRILLNAIFALSARHLNKIGKYDPYASNRYHDECLKYLIPMLNDASTISDQSVFAATIVLRVLEEIDVAAVGIDSQGHMLGIQVFVSAIDPAPMKGDLSEAAFWVGLRQEIYSAMMHHKTLKLNLEHCQVDRSTSPATDFMWANRACVHCADVLNVCFAEDGVTVSRWMKLKEYNDAWKFSRPGSFNPIFHRAADGDQGHVIPEIWHHHPCHIIGVQHHLLASLLLLIFNPTIPKTGPSRLAAEREAETAIRLDLLELCGIGMHNGWTPPAMFTACMGIALAGDRIKGREDQEALLGILVQTEKDHARPTKAIQEQMMEAWDWGK